MPACPVGLADRTGVVKILAFFELEPRLNDKPNLAGQAKMNIFQRSQVNILSKITNDLWE